MRVLIDAALALLQQGPTVLVTVQATQGSTPREAGAWMLVNSQGQCGSIGGGRLEWEAAAHARALLADGSLVRTQRQALGPSLGQCCGGVVELSYGLWGQVLTTQDLAAAQQRLQALRGPLMPVAVFGAGHVGRAIVKLLADLPAQVIWRDSREQAFDEGVPAGVQAEVSEVSASAVAELPPRSRVLIMSHSHAEDFELVRACLQRQQARQDLALIGLIGSRSKWAGFRQRLLQRGFSEVELQAVACPIGLPGIEGKQPAVIAVAVVAQLLQGEGASSRV